MLKRETGKRGYQHDRRVLERGEERTKESKKQDKRKDWEWVEDGWWWCKGRFAGPEKGQKQRQKGSSRDREWGHQGARELQLKG